MTRPRLSIVDPSSQPIGPAELRRLSAPECDELSVATDLAPLSEGLRIGLLVAGLIALSCAALALFAAIVAR